MEKKRNYNGLIFYFTEITNLKKKFKMKPTITFLFTISICVALIEAGDMMRKSIVFDKNTPDVFYCPIHKPTGFDKLIVR